MANGGAPNMFGGQMNGMPGAMNLGIGGALGGFQLPNTQAPRPKRDYPPQYSLYVGNLSDKTYDLDLYKFFTSHGFTVSSAKVMYDKDTEKMRGFAYLNFYSQDEALKCLSEMNNAIIDGKQIVLSKKKDSDFDSKANLVVKNLAKDITQKDLSELFDKFGVIKSCKLETFKNGESRGFGYVQFDTPETAQKAIEGLDNTDQKGKKIIVLVHSKKDEREGQGD